MNRLALPLSLGALAVLAACAQDPVTPAPAPVIIQQPAPVVSAPPPTVVVQQPAAPAPAVVAASTALRAGFGRIESITAAPQSAAAGSTTAGGTTMRRFGIRMEDGSLQYVDTAAPGYSLGDRIELTKDATIRRG
jgi:hypothetical protein